MAVSTNTMRRLLTALALVACTALATQTAAARPLPQAPDCPILPASNPWNQRVDQLPVAEGSRALIRTMAIPYLHPDFSDSDGAGYGIPYNVVDSDTPRRHVTFDYADESDPGPYPIPANPLIEGGSDRHLITVNRETCVLKELFAARKTVDGSWRAGSGAVFDLTSNQLRPAGWTSADAAGLPIFPGLARFHEIADGGFNHALRFTLPVTQRAYTWPARHYASSVIDPSTAPMGLRIRLKASYDISGFGPQTQAVLRAAKRYGLMLADNGSAGYISGAPARGWDDDDLHDLHQVPGSAFEVVDPSGLPGAKPPRIWNRHVRVSDGRARAQFFLTAASRVALQAVRNGAVVRTKTERARHGYVRLSMDAVRNASYRIRLNP
jgi:hypothetical protein